MISPQASVSLSDRPVSKPRCAALGLGRILGTAVFFCTAAWLAGAQAELRPWEESAVSVESGLLWQAGNKTPLSYRLVPTQFSWRSRETLGWQLDASRLSVRNRLTLMGTWFQQGPESRYVAIAASPSIEWWNKQGTWCMYGGAGGGFGWLDSQGVLGGQGQDFTFNWFGRLGVENIRSNRIRWTAGLMFLHLSNRGLTNPNPGIDAVGATVGWAWSF